MPIQNRSEFLAVTTDDISEYSIGLGPEFFIKYLSEFSGLKFNHFITVFLTRWRT